MYRPIGMGSDGFQPAESSPKATRASAPAPRSQRSKRPQRRPSMHRPSLELSSQSERPRGPIADGAGGARAPRSFFAPRNPGMPTLRQQSVDERLDLLPSIEDRTHSDRRILAEVRGMTLPALRDPCKKLRDELGR